VTEALVIATLALPVCAAGLLALRLPAVAARRLNAACAIAVAAAAGALAITELTQIGEPVTGRWYVVDPAGAVFLLTIAAVGLLSALASPSYLSASSQSFFAGSRARARGAYYAALYLFWAALLAVAVVDNLAVAWLLIEATTAASALLVAFSGRPNALEAGWKYLVLTTLGLAVALLGIIALYAELAHGRGNGSLATLDWHSIHQLAAGLDHRPALLALVLILGGLAAKVGWSPVHNWLPDAHSEAPPPVSALLSAALLPTVMLVAWRVQVALGPATGGAGSALLLAAGLLSLAVAVPFLWRELPLKRLLAYSSLEHMGILALGMGFANPLATAGVVLHVGGHALAKALGFYATIPLLRRDPQLGRVPARGLFATSPAGATAVAVALVSLSGLPPSPIFFSELLILAGGLAAGQTAVVVVAAGLLALGFLGLAHALIEGVVSEVPPGAGSPAPAEPRLRLLTALVGVALLALSASIAVLPGSRLVDQLMGAVL
jgi:hydrogenase-4 component F